MTTPGGNGPIETAYIEIKPQVSPAFAAEVRAQVLPILKKIEQEANAAFKRIEVGSRDASLGVRSVTRSLNSASKASSKFAASAVADSAAAAGAYRAMGRAGTGAFRDMGREVAESTRQVDGFNKSFSFTRYVVRNIARAAIISAGAAVAGLGAYAVVTAGKLEQIQIAFDGLMGSAEAGKAYTDELQEFAAKTPFDFPGLAKGAQRLISIGQTGDQAIATLKNVGDAAAATGQGSEAVNRVVTALAQIQAKGKLSAEEINQVAEALPNLDRSKVITNLAEAFGVTEQKIREMQEKGLVPAEAGIQALLKALREAPGALGAMDRQAVTLMGRFETFKDTVNKNISESIQSSLPALGAALGSLTTLIDAELKTLGPAIGEGLTTLAPFIEDFVQGVAPILESIFADVTPLLAALGPALIPLGEAISATLSALGPALVPLADAIAQIATAVGPLVGIIGVGLGDAIGMLAPLLTTVSDMLRNIFSNATPIFEALLDAIVPVIGVLADALIPIVEEVGIAIIQLLPSLLPMIEAFAELTVALTPLINLLSLELVTVLQILLPIIQFLVEKGVVVLTYEMEKLTKIVDDTTAAIRFFANNVLNSLGTVLTAAAMAANALGFEGLGSKLSSAAFEVAKFQVSVNSSLDAIQREVNIVVRTTFVTARVELNTLADEKKFARDSRAKTIAQAKKVIAPTVGPRPQFLPGRSSGGGGGGGASKAASEAKKAAAEVQKALIKLADAALDSAKAVADGIKAKLDTASDLLEKLRDQFADIRDSIKDAFSVDLFESRSAKQFLKRATKNIRTNTTVLASQNVLQRALGNQAGGSDFLKQLFESGNTRLIKNLAAQSSATLADVLAKFNQDNALANKIGTAVAEAFVVGGKPLVVGIYTVREEVIRLQKLMVAALAKVEAATKARERLKAASGGIFSSATNLQVGEAGKEVVVPLTRPRAALDLLLRSGALGLPTVAAHIKSLENAAQSQSMDRLRALGVPSGPAYSSRPAAPAPALSLVPSIKVVKERTVNQTFHISEAGDARLTAASVAARTASHMDR